MDLPFHNEQLKFMIELSSYRIERLDPFFRFLNFFDTEYFFFLLIPFVWIGFSWLWGLRLCYLVVLNSIVNSILKGLIGWPRPTADLPSVGMFQFPNPGFPSGGAQIAFLLGGLMIYYSTHRWVKIVGALFILLISFSRLYLGVHYPLDILGGWVVGFLLLFLFIKGIGPLEKFLSSQSLLFCLILSEAIPLSVLLFLPSHKALQLCILMGIGLGVYGSLKYGLYLKNPKSILEGIGRGAVGAGVLFLLFFLWPKSISLLPLAFILGLWVSLGASPFCKLINRRYT